MNIKSPNYLIMKYLVIYEKSADGYSAYVPDLPGCTSSGADKIEIEKNIVEAIQLHIEVMKEEGLPIPQSHFPHSSPYNH